MYLHPELTNLSKIKATVLRSDSPLVFFSMNNSDWYNVRVDVRLLDSKSKTTYSDACRILIGELKIKLKELKSHLEKGNYNLPKSLFGLSIADNWEYLDKVLESNL